MGIMSDEELDRQAREEQRVEDLKMFACFALAGFLAGVGGPALSQIEKDDVGFCMRASGLAWGMAHAMMAQMRLREAGKE